MFKISRIGACSNEPKERGHHSYVDVGIIMGGRIGAKKVGVEGGGREP